MSKVVKGNWNDIPHSERVVRWERVLKTLDDMSEHAVDHHFDMGFWGEKTKCGTVGCAAGQCALQPWFKNRGFGIAFPQVGIEDGKPYYSWNWTGVGPESFFGSDGYHGIFVNGFDDTITGRKRSPRMVHAAVKRAVRKYIAQLKREG